MYQYVSNASVFDMDQKMAGISKQEVSSILTSDKLEFDEGIFLCVMISPLILGVFQREFSSFFSFVLCQTQVELILKTTCV